MTNSTSTFVNQREQCPKCASKGLDNSKDNLAVYSNGGRHCFSCGFTITGTASAAASSSSAYETTETTMPQHTVDAILGKRGISPTTLASYGVRMIEKNDDYYIVFPVHDATGSEYTQHYRLVDSGTGSLTRTMKYPKGIKLKTPLFGVNQVQSQTKIVLVCEGETDALIAATSLAGRTDIACVGLLGTTMANRAAMFAARYWGNLKIVIAFDSDDPGKEATTVFSESLAAHSEAVCHKLALPTGFKDIGDWLSSGAVAPLEFADFVLHAAPVMNSAFLNSEQVADRLEGYLRKISSDGGMKLKFSPRLSNAVKIQPGKLIGLLGDASQGKSTLAEHFVLEAITQKREVFFISAEMSAEEVAMKLMRTIRQEPLHQTGYVQNLPENEFNSILDDTRRLLHWLTMIDDFGTCNLATLEQYLLELGSYGKPPELVVIDHLLAIADNLDKDTLQDTCKQLKALARKYNTAILLLCHIRKPMQSQKRTIYRPVLADAYGSNGLQMYSDVVIAVAKDVEKSITMVETVKMERMEGVYADVMLKYEDWRLAELDETAPAALDYEQKEQETFEETTTF